MDNLDPFRMSDARFFTDYRNNHELNNYVQKVLCSINNGVCNNNNNYYLKLYLMRNSEKLHNKIKNDNFKDN